MNKLIFCISLLLTLCVSSCATLDDYDNSVESNFDVLWKTFDEHYCYFEQKGIDWQGVKDIYKPRALACRTTDDLFNTCAQMLDTLRDGHVNLSSSFNTSYYRRWWSDYPQDFNLRTLQEYYLEFDYRSTGGISYHTLAGGKIGYMYIPSFSSPIGTGNLNAIFAYFNDCDALVIDIRNNGGGMLSNVETLVSRFIDSEFTPAYIRHKTGPGHNDFSEPYPMTYHPAGTGKHWDKPVAVLTNRSCFSAANDFVSAMKQLPGVKIVGARTGGGGGMPFSSQMPCGWKVRFSACPVTDASGHDIEEGIDPSPGCEMHAPDTELAAGRDSILEFAISILLGL